MKCSRLLALAILLLTCMAFDARAQNPQPTPNINDPIMRFPTVRSPIESRARIQTNAIQGKIRWKKEYGLPSIDGGMTPDKATNCTAIRVQATIQEGMPGTFGSTVNVGYIALQNEPTEENGYYICSYSITDRNNDLPRNRAIVVSAFLGPYANPALNQALVTGRWYGGSDSQPPLGYQRVVDGGRGVTLTDSTPRVTVDFEVVYKPVLQGPR